MFNKPPTSTPPGHPFWVHTVNTNESVDILLMAHLMMN